MPVAQLGEGKLPPLNFPFRQNWMDYQLNWNTSEYGGVTSIRIHPKFIWTPDLLMYNRFGQFIVISNIGGRQRKKPWNFILIKFILFCGILDWKVDFLAPGHAMVMAGIFNVLCWFLWSDLATWSNINVKVFLLVIKTSSNSVCARMRSLAADQT